jgi:hypothetical protein
MDSNPDGEKKKLSPNGARYSYTIDEGDKIKL